MERVRTNQMQQLQAQKKKWEETKNPANRELIQVLGVEPRPAAKINAVRELYTKCCCAPCTTPEYQHKGQTG